MSLPQKERKKSSAGKIPLPTFSLLLKIPETRCRASASNSRKFKRNIVVWDPDKSFNAQDSWKMKLFLLCFLIIDFLSKEIVSFPSQLSYSVNAVLTADAVRGDPCRLVRRGGSKRTKACLRKAGT